MPLFKKLNLSVKGVKVEFRVNINPDGKFWCQSELFTNHDGKITDETFNAVERLIYQEIQLHNDNATVHQYFIQYRLHLSRHLKSSFSDIKSVGKISDELWQKTNGVGSEYMNQESCGFVLEWHPLVKTTCGNYFQMKRLKVAEAEDFEYVANFGELFVRDLHYPFGENEPALFAVKDFHSFQGGEHYFELPLTKETLAFFVATEKGLAEVIGKFLLFLSQDSNQLMAQITKELAGSKQPFLLLDETE